MTLHVLVARCLVKDILCVILKMGGPYNGQHPREKKELLPCFESLSTISKVSNRLKHCPPSN